MSAMTPGPLPTIAVEPIPGTSTTMVPTSPIRKIPSTIDLHSCHGPWSAPDHRGRASTGDFGSGRGNNHPRPRESIRSPVVTDNSPRPATQFVAPPGEDEPFDVDQLLDLIDTLDPEALNRPEPVAPPQQAPAPKAPKRQPPPLIPEEVMLEHLRDEIPDGTQSLEDLMEFLASAQGIRPRKAPPATIQAGNSGPPKFQLEMIKGFTGTIRPALKKLADNWKGQMRLALHSAVRNMPATCGKLIEPRFQQMRYFRAFQAALPDQTHWAGTAAGLKQLTLLSCGIA
ncbi:Hypothetical protein FKW44_019523 [Caligus rogercresseyi]|uniref:Uncharacterized protein n=1 Tax=Caligus rogercresseyi TaxID=217165 RepID=A0A7T8JYH0_CALRO|nr:Hypothetical protein FKW44_019523 [Caligus rogercresseyi]